jgi:hypothetical protein
MKRQTAPKTKPSQGTGHAARTICPRQLQNVRDKFKKRQGCVELAFWQLPMGHYLALNPPFRTCVYRTIPQYQNTIPAQNGTLLAESLDSRLGGKHDFNTLFLSDVGDFMPKPLQQETIQIKVSPKLKKEIRRSALESDETLRTFILKALQNRGVTISDEELIDRRKAVRG